MPEIKAEKLEQLLEKDKDIIEVARENLQGQVDKASKEYR